MSRRRARCYQLEDGTVVRGDRPPTPADLETLAAFGRALEAQQTALDPEEREKIQARYEAGQQRIRERNARILGR